MTAAILLNATPDRITTVKGTLVTLTNASDVGVLGWEWTLNDRPIASSAVLTDPLDATALITVDVEGSYILQLITYADAGRTIIDSVDTAIIRVPYIGKYNWVIPGAGETIEDDPIRGWATKVESLLIQVQEFLSGERDFKESCRATSAGVLPAYGRIGDVITESVVATGLPAQDGVTLTVGQRFLFRNGASAVDNGYYDVTQVGDGSDPFILTRSEDFNRDAEVTAGATCVIEEGTGFGGALFTVVSPDPIAVNADPINFAFVGTVVSNDYTQTFIEADFAAGALAVPHTLGVPIANVTVKNDLDKVITPDDVTFSDTNNISLDLQSHRPITGTWTILVR